MGKLGASIFVIIMLAAIGLALYACHQTYFG
jgi:hypothetical protein